jgi:2-dehydropantoate 2-reductase
MKGKYRFGFVGAGPAGGIMAAYLGKAGHPVVLVDVIESHLNEIKKNGLTLTGVKEMRAIFDPGSICYSIDELKDKDVNVVFVSVKASHLSCIVPQLQKALKPGTTLVSLQNGMDTEAYIAETFGRENVLRVVINYAGNLKSDGTILYTFFNGPNYIGVIDPSRVETAKEIAAILTDAELDTVYTPEIQKHVWEKVLLNSALSAVCALTRKTMSQIMNSEKTIVIVRNLLEEGIAVARASGIDLGEGFFDHSLGYLTKGGNHYPSMYFDIERGNPSEIDFINGKIVEYGIENNIPTPYNLTITSLVHGVELALSDRG